MERNLSLLYESLFSILSSELAIYREMEGILQSEKKAIVLSSLPVLAESNQLKEEMANRAAVLERSRMEVVRQIASHLRVAPETINLTHLMSYLQVSEQERLRRFQAELKEMTVKIRTLNSENRQLAEAALLYAKSWFEYFRQLMSPQKGYIGNGRVQHASINGKIINKRG